MKAKEHYLHLNHGHQSTIQIHLANQLCLKTNSYIVVAFNLNFQELVAVEPSGHENTENLVFRWDLAFCVFDWMPRELENNWGVTIKVKEKTKQQIADEFETQQWPENSEFEWDFISNKPVLWFHLKATNCWCPWHGRGKHAGEAYQLNHQRWKSIN